MINNNKSPAEDEWSQDMGDLSVFPGGELSIQGEQQAEHYQTLWADEGTVSEWVDEAEEGYIVCRERARHGYKRVKRGEALSFVGKTKSGYYVRRDLCPDCQAVELVELWLLQPKKGTKNIVDKAVRVLSYPNYIKKDYQGKPGNGRMKPGMIRDVLVTKSMKGMDLRNIEAEIAEYEAMHLPPVVSAS